MGEKGMEEIGSHGFLAIHNSMTFFNVNYVGQVVDQLVDMAIGVCIMLATLQATPHSFKNLTNF